MNEKFDNMKEDNKQTNDSLRQQTKEDKDVYKRQILFSVKKPK